MAFLAAIAPALTLVSAGLGAVGAIQAGNASAAAADYNAKLMDQNARVAMDQAAAQAEQENKKTRQLVAAAEAGAAESGLTLTGSTGAVINQARDTGNMNQLLAIYDGSLKATGYRANANLERANARASRIAGFFGAGTQLLGGAADFYKTKQLAV